jgi:hypothetical protein
MKIVIAVMALLAVIYFMSAFTQRTDSINGSSQVAAFKSAKKIKRYMTERQQHEFETAFWALGTIKAKEGPDAFLAAVDGKTADEVVAMAEQEVKAKIAAGDPDFKQFGSWENLVNDAAERDKRKSSRGEPVQPLRNSVRSGRPDTNAAQPQPVPAVAQ